MAEIIGKRYLILKQIGKGGMADVFLAQDMILKREVAIKILHGDLSNDAVALERFHREAGASTSLSHPNIVDIYDVGEDQKKYYIVMEYVKGYTLKQLIQKRGPIPVKEAVWLMKQLSSALQEAHRNGIIHRDVKSQNVLIKPDGTVKLSDFGIALANDAMQITSKDAVLGSVHYLAPEVAKGGLATSQSDIYSLGIVFYEILVGDVPFKGDQPVNIAMQHIRSQIPSVRSFNPLIPQAVENIIIRATAKNLALRYKDVETMLADLEVCLLPEHAADAPLIVKATPVQPTAKKKRVRKSHKWLYALSVFALLFVSTLLVIGILYIGGAIGKTHKKVIVPELKGLAVIDADDLLNDLGLSIDYSNIERVMTDDTEAGKIVSYSPGKDTSLERGSRIKIVVSEGIYAHAENYIGQKIKDVRAKLAQSGLILEEIPVESNEKPGTIVAQDGLAPGDKYNPNIINTVKLSYSRYPTALIPFGLLGQSISSVQERLQELGFVSRVEEISRSSLNDRELSYGAGNVVRISPSEGTSYRQEEGAGIILYTYKEE